MMIGTAVDVSFLNEPEYDRILASQFSVVEAENHMKFEPIHPRRDSDRQPFDWAPSDQLVAYAQSHSMKVRGHTLLWHQQNPRWLTQGGFDSKLLAKTLENHIKTVVGHFRGKVFAWDVVNEAFSDQGGLRDSIWQNKPGIGQPGTKMIEQALRWARFADPKAKLFYNDYGAELFNKKSDDIFAMAKDFKARGVPLDGIGFQAHIGFWLDTPENLAAFKKNLRRFGALGLDIHITELDLGLREKDPAAFQRQADLYAKVMKICLAEPQVKLVQFWGFTDKHSWLRGQAALLWDENYQPKPSFDAVLKALK
jgi:endo-1,4-beta-xylanase